MLKLASKCSFRQLETKSLRQNSFLKSDVLIDYSSTVKHSAQSYTTVIINFDLFYVFVFIVLRSFDNERMAATFLLVEAQSATPRGRFVD